MTRILGSKALSEVSRELRDQEEAFRDKIAEPVDTALRIYDLLEKFQGGKIVRGRSLVFIDGKGRRWGVSAPYGPMKMTHELQEIGIESISKFDSRLVEIKVTLWYSLFSLDELERTRKIIYTASLSKAITAVNRQEIECKLKAYYSNPGSL